MGDVPWLRMMSTSVGYMVQTTLSTVDRGQRFKLITTKSYTKNGTEITGILQAFDLHLNLWLEEADATKDDTQIKIGSTLIRGDTIIYASPQ